MPDARDATPYAPPPPADIRVNPVRSGADWEAMRDACLQDPGTFHGDIAAREIHWYHPELDAWLSRGDDGRWRGWRLAGAAPAELDHWTPWRTAFDGSEAPFYRWFSGGLTNAAFNEVDRHVAAGFGAEPAYFYEGDRWDPAAHGGRGGPLTESVLTRRELFVRSVLAALALRALGLKQGERIAFNMPNILDQIVWTEGAKRLGVIYTAVFGGFSDKTLADRIADAGARLVVTADGASRNAETVPFKAAYCDPALERHLPLARALAVLRAESRALGDSAASMDGQVAEALAGEITVTAADVMRAAGAVLARQAALEPAQLACFRARLAAALAGARPGVEKVIVVRHTGLAELPWTAGRDLWAHELLAAAERDLLAACALPSMDALRALPDAELAAALWRACPAQPVDADYPLFVIYTSGSTGKPKGVVHVHGGWVAGVAHTMKVSFDAVPGRDVIYVVADPGWITGQSYLITASLAARIPGVVAEGSPVFPDAGRFASIIERRGVTIFKAGVTFLKTVMTDPQNRADVEEHDLSRLRVATFCAEPVSPAVQRFGMELMTPQYINSYWATEHGGIAWTHPWGNADQPLRADAHSYPLPWVAGDVWVPEGEADAAGRCRYRVAADGERGEVVVIAPYPYLARTIWGDADNVGRPGWRGDIGRFARTYFGRFRDEADRPVWAYLQGDFAVRYADGSFSFHGRSDDVINVSGHRMGTEEIEGAILRDKQLNPESPVGNCIVVGAPHREKGLTPVAFVLEAPGRSLRADDERRLRELVREEKGAVAVPSDFIAVPAFPETRSGKYMRRFLRDLILGEPLGDATTLRNPECLPEIARRIADWQRRQSRAESQQVFQRQRFLSVQFDRVDRGGDGPVQVATVRLAHPPVNALSDHLLDELATALEHLERRGDVRAVVLASELPGVFVAGADVRHLAEGIAGEQDARGYTGKAHALFAQMERMRKPLIAAVDGLALGGGCELLAACHLRVGTPRARLGQPEINLFLPPGFGGTQRLPRLMAAAAEEPGTGIARALLMLLNGRQVDAQSAHAWGLLDRLTAPGEDALGAALALAAEAARSGSGVAGRAMARRHALVAAWRESAAFDETLLDDPDVAGALRQCIAVGREAPARAIVELVREGFRRGFDAGLALEVQTFARFVLDAEHGGRRGIPLFLERRSPPLPARPRPAFSADTVARMESRGELLAPGSPFLPGITPLPRWQHAQAILRDHASGAPAHGEPRDAERAAVLPVPVPGPNQALLYVLASELNFNDVWAITGVPVSPFDGHDEDVHVTGSGGIGMVAALGEALQAEGRLRVGDVVAIYPGRSDLLDPRAGADPMRTRFANQGYETPDGSHQQFTLADGPQCFPPPSGLSLEQAGSYILMGGTVYRALATALQVQPGRRLLVEGAAAGTGAWTVELGRALRLSVTGMVSSQSRAEAVQSRGARTVNRADPAFAACFGGVPDDPARWGEWARAGEPFLAAVRAANDGQLVDYAVSHAGERSFGRSFQALAPGGVITFYGASSGYRLSFVGKPGTAGAHEMLERARLAPGESVLVFYGAGDTVDAAALEAIEQARAAGARICVVTDTDAERDFVLSLGYGDAVAGALSLAELQRRVPHFAWPEGMPPLPDPQRDPAGFREAVRVYGENTVKPLAGAVSRVLRSGADPRGVPDVVVERARRDSLAAAITLVRPHTGRVVYVGDMDGRRYTFYAQQVWMRQRRILMPTAEIRGTHLCSAAEVAALNRLVASGRIEVPPVHLFEWGRCAEAHQAIWENRLPELTGGAAKAMLNHALPEAGLTGREELLEAWAAPSGRAPSPPSS